MCERVARVHQPGRVIAVADEIRNIVDYRDFGVDHGVLSTDTAHSQVREPELVADVHGPPRLAEFGGGLRVGVQGCLRIALEQRGQPFGVSMVGMLMGDQDRREPGDALETVRENARIEQHSGIAKSGE